jgi:hypothetical protein
MVMVTVANVTCGTSIAHHSGWYSTVHVSGREAEAVTTHGMPEKDSRADTSGIVYLPDRIASSSLRHRPLGYKHAKITAARLRRRSGRFLMMRPGPKDAA